MAGDPHFLEDTDISTRNVRDAEAEQRPKSIRTHEPRAPCMSSTPVMAHEYSTGDPQRIKQTD